MNGDIPQFDVIESIGKHVEMLKPCFPKQTIVCIGDYPVKILLKSAIPGQMDDTTLPIFIDKSSVDVAKWSQSRVGAYNILGLDAKIDTHFMFNVLPHIKDSTLIERLKNKPFNDIGGAIIVASLWDGIGSAFLPAFISQFKEWNINSVALGLLPSKAQPSDAHFNAFSSMGICAAEDATTLLLIDRDQLESYVGVDRNGSPITGNDSLRYILELMLAKETLAQELSELSRSFNVRMYALLSATGSSLKIYSSIKNILDTTLLRPFLRFDLSSSLLLYVIVRFSIQLKDKLSKGKIELEIANWFREKANLQSIFISEPIYVEDVTDRIDIVMFVGGFDLTERFTRLEKKVRLIKSRAIKQGLLNEEEWQNIVKNLKNIEGTSA